MSEEAHLVQNVKRVHLPLPRICTLPVFLLNVLFPFLRFFFEWVFCVGLFLCGWVAEGVGHACVSVSVCVCESV